MPRRARSLPALAAALAFLVVAATSPAAVVQAAVPAPRPLAQGWQLHPDAADAGLAEDWPAVPPQEGWRATSVPGVLDGLPLKARFDGTVGWYRVRFRGPATPAGFAWALHFDGVRRTARVWLNGREVGRHSDPYVPFELPATGLRPGASNELLVRVDNRRTPGLREGWWNWGGIVRPVSLVPRGPLLLRDPGLLPEVSCEPGGGGCTAKALVDGMLENRGSTAVTAPRVRVRLDPPAAGGAAIVRTVALRGLQPGEATRVRFEVAVPDPALWAPGSPQLYNATVTTLAGATPAQVDERRIGLRGVRVRDGVLELNGRQLDLRGASIQEDEPGRGPAMRPADIRRVVSELRAVHANVTRAHYGLDPRLLDALDAAGIMVWSQAPIYHRDEQLKTPGQRAAALGTLRRTVLESRSHPSVITHSVANELSPVPDEKPGTAAYLEAAVRTVRAADPTLPVSVDLLSYPGYPAAKAYARYDLIGINSYFGWYPGKRDHSTARLADLGPYLDRMRLLYPTQGLVLTEFGAESTFTGPVTEKETYAFQTDYLRAVLGTVAERPFMSGAIYWTLREFAVKPDWDGGAGRDVPRDGIHNKGLITYAGMRKPAWAAAEQEFAATPVFRSAPAAATTATSAGADSGVRGRALLVSATSLVAALLVLDVWFLIGLLRGRRPRFIPLPST